MSFFSALLRLLVGRGKPKPPPVTQPAVLRCGVSVRDWWGDGLASATGTLTPAAGSVVAGVNDGGRLAFETTARGAAVLALRAPGYRTRLINLAIVAELGDYQLQRAYPVVGTLDVTGKLFTMDGVPHRRKMVSVFLALRRWDRGEDLSGLVDWTHDKKLNGWRVFCQWFNNVDAPFGPNVIPPERIAAFCDWMAAHGLTVKLTILTDCQYFEQTHEQQVARVRAVLAAVAGKPGVSVQLGNETFKNGCDVYRIATDLQLWEKANRPVPIDTGDFVITAAGGGDGNPNFRALDEIGDHGGRGEERVVDAPKTGHFMYDGWPKDEHNDGNRGFRGQSVACTEDEPIGCEESDLPGRTDANPNNWADMGAGWAIGTAGGTFHGRTTMVAQVPGRIESECARRMGEAMDFFPEDVFSGRYQHDGLADHPLETAGNTATEVVSYLLGNRAYVVATQPTEAYQPVPRNGWRIVKVGGWRGNYLWLER